MDTKNLISLVFFLQSISNAVSVPVAQNPGLRIINQSFMCSKTGELTSSNIIKRERAFGSLLSTYDDGPSKGTEVWYIDEFSAEAICPPKIKACRECVNNTSTYLKNKCPKQKEGVAWTVSEKLICVVRYADYTLADNVGQWASATFPSPPNQSPFTPAELEKELNNLANKLKDKVARTSLRYGSGSVTFGPGSRTLYGLMQCTYGTLAVPDCMKCLSDMTNRVHSCCSKQRSSSGIAATSTCYFWYQHNNFIP